MIDKKEKNYQYFKRELGALLADPLRDGKFVVIHDEHVNYIADSFQQALKHALENLPADEFIIQQVIDETKFINFLAKAV